MFTMINSDLFTKRIQEILTYYNLSAAAFAEKMGVGRSSISHITSGRNKPSLEFVLHILENFKEVTFDWLMFGKGSFPQSKQISENNTSHTLFSEVKETTVNKEKTSDLATEFLNDTSSIAKNHNKAIERIVIFYADKTFVEYKN